MVVMEVTLPSGYTVDNDALPSLRLSNNVKRIETKDGDSVVMLYFDKVPTDISECIGIDHGRTGFRNLFAFPIRTKRRPNTASVVAPAVETTSRKPDVPG